MGSVPFSVGLGLVLALGTAVVSIVGFLLKHRGAVRAPAVEWRRPVHSTIALFRSPVYALGCVVATSSWGLHVGALALAPISLVQTIIAGGLVLLTVIADRAFGLPVSKREWVGVAVCATGLALLAATLDGAASSAHASYDGLRLGLYVGLSTLTGLALVPLAAKRNRRPGLTLAASAGLLWGASDLTIKALSGKTHDLGLLVIVHPFALLILVLSLVGLLVSARSLQLGPVVPVIALTSACANILTIAAGPLVFREPLPSAPAELAVRVLAFVLVVGAAALTPPPLAAEQQTAA